MQAPHIVRNPELAAPALLVSEPQCLQQWRLPPEARVGRCTTGPKDRVSPLQIRPRQPLQLSALPNGSGSMLEPLCGSGSMVFTPNMQEMLSIQPFHFRLFGHAQPLSRESL